MAVSALLGHFGRSVYQTGNDLPPSLPVAGYGVKNFLAEVPATVTAKIPGFLPARLPATSLVGEHVAAVALRAGI